MQTTTACHALVGFRRTMYAECLGRRKDSLFELADAVLASPGPETPARLSLAPVFRRRWPSVADALAAGEVDRAPQPLWLAWHGGPLPADLLDLWRWYRRRFVIEHGFRFLKHDRGWTTARPADPAAA